MNKFITKLAKLTLGLAMAAGVGAAVSAGRKNAESVRGANPGDSVTWTWTAASGNKLSTTAGANTLSGKVGTTSVSISATTTVSGGAITSTYNDKDYGGQQMGSSSKTMTDFSLTFGNPWSGTGTYKDYTKITSVSLSGSSNSSLTSTVSVTIGGKTANNTNSINTLFKGTGKTPNTCIFGPGDSDSGVIVISVNSTGNSKKAWYLTSFSITAQVPAGASTAASISGNSSVYSGVQWTTGGITEDNTGTPVTGATYSFTPSSGVSIPSHDENAGTFTATIASGSGTVTVNATKSGYTIPSFTVTVNTCTHNWVAGTTHSPTCTEQGYTEYTCSVCGAHKNDTYVDPLGHDYGEWVITKNPTCTETGSKYRVCSRDGSHIENATIPALGHTYVAGTVVPPTCTEGGYTPYTCSVCGDSYHGDLTAALGHDWGELIVDTPATCTEEGSGHHECSRCDAIQNEVIPATGHTYVNHVCSVCGAKEPQTATFNIATLASNRSWSSGTAYSPVVISPISLTAVGGGNNGKYYSSNNTWRTYSAGGASISADLGYTVISVTSNPSKTFTITDGVASYSGAAEFKEIVVTYQEVDVEKYTVSFNGNGAVGSISPVENVIGSYTLPSNSYTVPSGKRFGGWKAGDSQGFDGDLIAAGASYTVSEDVTFWAQWIDVSTISFNGNGASGSMASATIDTNTSYTLPSNGFTVPSGKTFAGWKVGNAGDTLAAGTDYTVTASSVTLYAQWSDIYTVSFNANGAAGSMSSVTSGSSYTLPVNGFTVPSGKQFDGWKVDNEGETLTAGSEYTLTKDVTLYAQWVDKQNLGGLVDKEYFFVIIGGHVLKAGEFSATGADTYTASNSSVEGLSLSDAWYFTSTGTDDQWYIRTSNADNAAYLKVAGTSDNNQLASSASSDSWTILSGTGTYANKLIMQDSNNSRFASYTSYSKSYIRTYANTNTGNCEVSFVKYVVPEITITGKTAEYTDTAVALSSSAGASTSWAITTNPDSKGSLSSASGASTNLSVTGAGTFIVTASASGYVSSTITVTFTERPTYFITMSGIAESGDDELGIKGKGVIVTISDSNLQGTGIDWTVTSGQVKNGSGTSSQFTGIFDSTGTVTIVATDNGNAQNTASVSFTVIEGLNAINAKTDSTSTIRFTSSGKTGNSAEANDGTVWAISSDASEQNGDPTSGIHYGSNNTSSGYVQYIQMSTSDITGVVSKVTVNARAVDSDADLTVTVGGVNFKCNGENAAQPNNISDNYVFTGNGSGSIVVRIDKGEAKIKALYLGGVVVESTSATTSNVANTDATVQQEVLDFVAVMNEDLSVCSSSSILSTSVWSGLGDKFDEAVGDSTNAVLFKQMFKYADATPRAGDGSATTGDSLQNALARYNYVLEKYGTDDYADFLHRAEANKVTPKSAGLNPLLSTFIGKNTNSIAIIVIISMVSVTAIGGYFFLRKRKEQ